MKTKIITDIQVKLKIRKMWFELHSLQFNQDLQKVKQIMNMLSDLEGDLDYKIYCKELETLNN